MIGSLKNRGALFTSNRMQSDEVEALQTDVMRFMAILGFCLMVIFALVQSIPTHKADSPPNIVPSQIPSEITVKDDGADDVVKDALPEKLEKRAPDESLSEEKGFSLHFENDGALIHLVRHKKVHLYGIAGQKGWRALFSENRLGFLLSKLPTQYHEMTAATVPLTVRSQFSKSVAAFNQPIRWGVVLPESMRLQIQRIMTDQAGGEMVIDANGQVKLKHEEI